MRNDVDATVAGYRVVASGVLLCHQGEEAAIQPFEDDFEIQFAFRFEDSDENKKIRIVPSKNRSTRLLVSGGFSAGALITTGERISLAWEDDESAEFKGSFAFSLVGTSSKHMIITTYTITSHPAVES